MALRRYRGGTSALGKAYYKGGFENKMNRREAALILETKYVHPRINERMMRVHPEKYKMADEPDDTVIEASQRT